MSRFRPPQTLFGRLVLVFLGFGAAMTLALSLVMQVSHRVYHQEADQTVNRALARQFVEANFLLGDVPLTVSTLHRGLAKLSAANPDVDVYLLDGAGSVVAASVPESDWRGSTVDLQPLRALLAGGELPIVGSNPRDTQRREIFSASPVSIPDCPAQYLYIVLHRNEHVAGAQRLRTLYAIGEGASVMILAATLAVILSLLVVRQLTRRLSVLDTAMQRFETSGNIPHMLADVPPAAGDEIDRLSAVFSRLAARVQAQMQGLQATDSMRREVLANVSHDLRTPLTTLQAHLEILSLNDARLLPAERNEYVAVALRQTRRLIVFVQQLLEVAKLDAAHVSMHVEPLAMPDLVQDVAQKFSLSAEAHGVALELDVQTDLPWVHADIALIERVLDNLIENALEHSPRGGRVELTVRREGDYVRVSVLDSGPGLTQAEIDHVFDRFFQGMGRTTRNTGHAGLGLAIVKSILELHGERIKVDGRPGRGACFSFTLPIVAQPAPQPDRGDEPAVTLG